MGKRKIMIGCGSMKLRGCYQNSFKRNLGIWENIDKWGDLVLESREIRVF